MTTRDYEKFAREIKQHVPNTAVDFHGLKIAARIAANVFAEDNPRFNQARFFDACGLSNVEEL